jgi:hypothetical protein
LKGTQSYRSLEEIQQMVRNVYRYVYGIYFTSGKYLDLLIRRLDKSAQTEDS